jgi:hypothetical protein
MNMMSMFSPVGKETRIPVSTSIPLSTATIESQPVHSSQSIVPLVASTVQSTLDSFLNNRLQDILQSHLDIMRQQFQNIHLDMIKQFQLERDMVSEIIERQDVKSQLQQEEIERLKVEIQRLRSKCIE